MFVGLSKDHLVLHFTHFVLASEQVRSGTVDLSIDANSTVQGSSTLLVIRGQGLPTLEIGLLLQQAGEILREALNQIRPVAHAVGIEKV